MTPADVSDALQKQNVILPSGDVKIGTKDYMLTMNNSPDVIEAINSFPIKQIDGRTVFMRDVAHVHDGFQVQTNSVAVDGVPGALMTIRKTGGVSTLAVIDGVRAALPDIEHMLPKGVSIKAIFDQSVFVKASLNSVVMGGCMAAGLTALMILLFLGNWRLTIIILAAIPLSIITAVLLHGRRRRDAQHHDPGRLRPRRRYPRRQRHGGDREHRAPRWPARSVCRTRSSTAPARSVSPRCSRRCASASCSCRCSCCEGTAKYLFSPLSVSVIVVVAGEPGAVVHDGAGAVQCPDAQRCRATGRPRTLRRSTARERPNIFHAHPPGASSAASSASARVTAMPWPGRCPRSRSR